MLLLTLLACAPEVSLGTNPICDLSAIVSWQTRRPAAGWVEFGEGALTHRVDGPEATEHEIVAVGMKPDRTYQIQAVWQTEGGDEVRGPLQTFETGPLPYDWLAGDVDVLEPDLMQPGWTLANIHTGAVTPVVAALLDADGDPVWYYLHDGDDGRADLQISSPAPGEVLIGPGVAVGDRPLQIDLAGEVLWEGPEQGGFDDVVVLQDDQLHHVLTRLPEGEHGEFGGSFVTVRSQTNDVIGDGLALGDQVEIMSPDHETIWSWSAWDHLAYDPEDVYLAIWWTHMNSVGLLDGYAYINSWVLHEMFKVDLATGELVWRLGEGGDFAADPSSAHPWFQHAHSFDPLGDGRFLVYDNGAPERGFSRVVEYALDEAAMTAEIVWEYPGDLAEDDWYNLPEGDADRLENGNTLINAGNAGQGYSPSRLLEVTPAGEAAWQMWWYAGDDHEVGAYQAERIPALARPL